MNSGIGIPSRRTANGSNKDLVKGLVLIVIKDSVVVRPSLGLATDDYKTTEHAHDAEESMTCPTTLPMPPCPFPSDESVPSTLSIYYHLLLPIPRVLFFSSDPIPPPTPLTLALAAGLQLAAELLLPRCLQKD